MSCPPHVCRAYGLATSDQAALSCRFVWMHNPDPPSGLRHTSMPSSGMLARGRMLVSFVPPHSCMQNGLGPPEGHAL